MYIIYHPETIFGQRPSPKSSIKRGAAGHSDAPALLPQCGV